jgi:thioredoxin reductase (NADPH)
MTPDSDCDVAVVGGGIAGLSAGIFTARHGLETVVLDAGGSILQRNAHLENYPGFPAGVNARRLLGMVRDQAERAGCALREARVARVRVTDAGFEVETTAGSRWSAEYVVAASKNETGYLDEVAGVGIVSRGKTFIDTDERGRTGVDGLYAAGRLAGKPHQTAVAAGHGAEVAVTLLEDADEPFYHDWVAPEGYFTGRDRDVPPGCEEIDETERRRRETESLAVLREQLEPIQDPPEQHPDVSRTGED